MNTARAIRIDTRSDAEQLVTGVLSTITELCNILEAETAQIRIGRFRDGLSQEARKGELAAAYLQGIETVKANIVAVTRLAPDSLPKLKEAHRGMMPVVDSNRLVLATARAVSEGLIKGIAEEMNRHARPQGYAPAGLQHKAPTAHTPLVLSRSL